MSYLSFYSSFIISIIFSLLVVAILYGLTVAGYWLVFAKARQPGWAALIPFYNIYTQYKISWDVRWFWVYSSGLILYVILHGHNWFLNGISYLAFLCSLGISLMAALKLAKVFDKDHAFAIGLFFLGPVFMLILGLDQSCYLGLQDQV